MSERISEIKDRLKIAMEERCKKSADLTRDLGIPSSAMSQYLSGKSKNMPIDRLHDIAIYLNVAETWLMGFDVPMSRNAPSSAASSAVILSPDESNLLDDYKKLNVEGKEEARKQVRNLTKIEDYTKDTASLVRKMA